MKKFRNIPYILGAIVLIIEIFFGDDMSEEFNHMSFLLLCILLSLVVIIEIIIIVQKKNKSK